LSETNSHKKAKLRAAGRGGRTEVPISGGRRLDALTKNGGRATEVERGGTAKRLSKAISRLKASGAKQKVLQVPQKDMSLARSKMRQAGMTGTVKNMSGTKKTRVRKRRKRTRR